MSGKPLTDDASQGNQGAGAPYITVAGACKVIKAGGVVALPTETVYGLAADATNAAAVEKIFALKGRPAHNPLIVHVSSLASAQQLQLINEAELKKNALAMGWLNAIAAQLWPGPVTVIVSANTAAVPRVVRAGLPTIALRAPAHPLMRQVLKKSGKPLAAPSANPSTHLSPTTAQHVVRGFNSVGTAPPPIVEGGPCKHGVESTVIDLTGSVPTVLRPGPLSASELADVLGCEVGVHSAKNEARGNEKDGAPPSPGMLLKHYSPRAKLTLVPTLEGADVRAGLDARSGSEQAKVYFKEGGDARAPGAHGARSVHSPAPHTFYLTQAGSLAQALQNMFSLLHRLDESGYAHIVWELPALEALKQAAGFSELDAGLHATLTDRLQRAAGLV